MRMITISAATLVAVFALLTTVITAAFGAIWYLANQMGRFNATIDGLTHAINRLADIPERVAVLEAGLNPKV